MITFAVHMPNDSLGYLAKDEGYKSNDNYAVQVSDFCKRNNLPYSNVFTSMVVYMETVDPCSLACNFGNSTVILRNERILPDVMIASSEDFQDVAYNGYKVGLCGYNTRSYRNKIHVLSKESTANKVQVLARIIESSMSTKYVEARIFRTLVADDVLVVLDRFGNKIPENVWR